MSIAQYTFLPWARQGISRDINEQDTLGGTAGRTGRATIDVSLALQGIPVGGWSMQPITEATEDPARPGKPVYKKVQLVGPGDVTGIKANAVVRTEPRANVGNFEPNYFPYIEFYEEDFPWRYTPARSVDGKLRPWLVLVVLEEAEFERRFLPGAALSAITNGQLPIAFPPASETWAWAHVQANEPFPAGNETVALQQLVEKDPNLASSRLICPRRLKPNTRYTAFLLPAFEQGRLSGLGAPPERILNEDIQQPSWGAHQNDEYQQLWPVYFEWEFQTSDQADFEYLVRRIEARVMEDPVGRRPMDMQDAGYNLSYTGVDDGVLLVEGALQIIDADESRLDFLAQDEAQGFVGKLRQILNLNDPSGSGPPVDTSLDIDGESDDPFVLPPLYGQWHAGKTRVEEGGDKPWFYSLNLDPRNRVAAGFGILVVRKNQDDYMDRAWEQAAEILEAQRRIRLARFSAETARQLQRSYFNDMDEATYSAFSSSMHARSLFPESDAGDKAVAQVVRKRVLQTGELSARLTTERNARQQKINEKENAETELQGILQAITAKEADITAKEAQIDSLNEEIDALEEDITSLTGQIAALNSQISEKTTSIDTLNSEIATLNGEIAALEQDLANASNSSEAAAITTQLNTVTTQRNQRVTQRDGLIAERDALVTQRDGLEADKDQKEATRNDKVNARITAQNELNVLNNQLVGLRNDEEDKRDEIQTLKNEIASLEQEILRLSRLHLPTSTLRQDYRKMARVNGPLLRRADIGEVAQDPMVEISLQVDETSTGTAVANTSVSKDWEDLQWGADTFRKMELVTVEGFAVTTPGLVRSQIQKFMEAYQGLNQRLRQLVQVPPETMVPGADTRTRPLLAYPEFREATYEALAKISSELMLPNVQRIPMDTFSLLEVNQRFIEAYLVGLNHEMARELLWREFPTDQRGSYFRSFWDDTDNLDTTFPPPDIELLTKMDQPLGQNLPADRPIPPPDPDNPNVVFVIRSELLKKFPNALVYMQKAKNVKAPRGLTTGTTANQRKMPVFQAKIDPEISFFGFPISAEEALGSDTDPGWFFVVQERPGEPRFGLDITAEDAGSSFDSINEWNDLAWPHVGVAPHDFLRINGLSREPLPPESGEPHTYTWGKNSAHMAGILLQLPFRAAVHATDMIKLPTDA
ncbi:MAG: hypothetical protein ACE362_22415 [Phaeodactylibacter xiamenensis]|uniref:Uncharacterized protein n=1 Tax=Phaeodactylibacter xiamenensis TaxID=1524460 RepID=A0A098S6N5_9BACT|nr:hypothetical protein [Phaeodactylibacter xiamenensis]KGE88124.1 hypothetical protein IX84_09840 [Phaeodactylibacter xiamenensis]MCR9052050.1 hypothetical protein [bacterium]